ncbi:hypothetical protein BGZ68_009746, partial [Mortierella alpina]
SPPDRDYPANLDDCLHDKHCVIITVGDRYTRYVGTALCYHRSGEVICCAEKIISVKDGGGTGGMPLPSTVEGLPHDTLNAVCNLKVHAGGTTIGLINKFVGEVLGDNMLVVLGTADQVKRVPSGLEDVCSCELPDLTEPVYADPLADVLKSLGNNTSKQWSLYDDNVSS